MSNISSNIFADMKTKMNMFYIQKLPLKDFLQNKCQTFCKILGKTLHIYDWINQIKNILLIQLSTATPKQ